MKKIEVINDEVESNNDYEWSGDWEYISDEQFADIKDFKEKYPHIFDILESI